MTPNLALMRPAAQFYPVRRPSLPRAPKLYSGPAIPTIWDANWQTYTNLTKAQIAAFQAMPEDLTFYAQHASWRSAEPPSHAVRPADAITAQADYVAKLTAWHGMLRDIHAKINAKTITSRAQIDAALAAIK